MAEPSQLDSHLHWYKDAIIYELHIKAFYDSNEDGIGDFQGLLEKLDYLEDLGVTAIWLLPFYPSPLKDDGYDIADYYSINPSYGDLAQLQRLLAEAHKRNLKVITELVINHTSDQHRWFQQARRAPRGSRERNYYVWTDNPSQYKDVRIIFQDFEASNWTWDEVAQQYYWHRFFHHQPDLNYDSPDVQEEVFRIIDYWCNMGVDGFRLDAVPYLFEREGTNGENLPETHAFLKKLRAHIDGHYPGTLMLAEANMWPEDSAAYFGNGDECHMNYHFPVMPRMFMAVQMEDRYPITDIFDQTPPIPPTCQWAMFLRNHDELTLEMVTDEERDYMYRVYAKDAKARINLGIRHRLAPLMENDRRKIELMNSLLFSMPGTPVIYYGDEIGMGDNFHLGDRDGVRTPMQWSPDRNAGFSRANPQQLYLPIVLDPQYNYEAVNVETQKRNTSSLFWFMKHLIGMRKRYKAFGRGDMKFLNVDNPKILAFTRSYQDETILIVVNLSKFSQPASIDLGSFAGHVPVEMFSKNPFPAVKENTPYFFTLGPHSFQWFHLEAPSAQPIGTGELQMLRMDEWNDLMDKEENREQLESVILPAFLGKTNWFWGKRNSIYSCKISDHVRIEVPGCRIAVLLIELAYKSGLPETYLLPLAFVRQQAGEALIQEFPQAIVGNLQIGQESGMLCDAFYTAPMQQWLFDHVAAADILEVENSTITFTGDARLAAFRREHPEIRPRNHLAKFQDNTAITYNNRFFLKIYRKLDTGVNPDHEVSRYLSKEAQFAYVPEYLGAIQWRFRRGSYVVGMMQELIENHGDGHTYMLERVNNFIERILAARKDIVNKLPFRGTFVSPVNFEALPTELQDLLGARACDQSRLLGVRTGELHLALAKGNASPEFATESFSLHYQRSLFSSALALVRESFHTMEKHKAAVGNEERGLIDSFQGSRDEILALFKKIYSHKLDAIKIRIHGSLSLAQVLLTGRDLAIHDFGGVPSRSYSEARLKRSPFWDVGYMVRSFYYAAYEGFLSTTHAKREEAAALFHYADIWIHYMRGFYLRSYINTIRGTDLLPAAPEDLEVMLKYFLLEKAMYALNYELVMRPDRAIIPLAMIRDILRPKPESAVTGQLA